MNKKQVKDILMSMRNPENEAQVNNLLGQIDLKTESEIERIVNQLGNSEENIRNFLEKRLSVESREEKYPINDMFTYGLDGSCIHLHLPNDLHKTLSTNGFSKTLAIVNLKLLDAIDKINQLKDDDFYRFKDKDSIFMISPIMLRKEIKFLEGLDFETEFYTKKQLKDEEFINDNSGASLALEKFGSDKNVGTAKIKFETIGTEEWKAKKEKVIEKLTEKVGDISSKKQKVV